MGSVLNIRKLTAQLLSIGRNGYTIFFSWQYIDFLFFAHTNFSAIFPNSQEKATKKAISIHKNKCVMPEILQIFQKVINRKIFHKNYMFVYR